MILRFQTKLNRNGNRKQIEFDTSKNTVKMGYCIFIDSEAVEISANDYNRLREAFADEGLLQSAL